MASNQFIARRGIISLDDAQITGSLSVTGNISASIFTGSFVGDGSQLTGVAGATTASYVEYSNVGNKPALVSGSSQITYSGLSGIPSGIVSGSSQVTYSGLTGIPSGIVSGSAQITGFGIFATTGSNQFNGSQAVTGSLTVTGQVVAQTLNVQQVTSSIVYSSGSNIFGNSLGNTQQFTGSVSVTGSLTVNGTSAVTGTGTTNYLPKFTGASTIGNSVVYDDGAVGISNITPSSYYNSQLVVGNDSASFGSITMATTATGLNSIFFSRSSSGAGRYRGSISYVQSDDSINFRNNGDALRMTLNSSGNLGLGVTPSAGWVQGKALEVGFVGTSLWGRYANESHLTMNYYYSTSANARVYASTNPASDYEQFNGNHTWYSAPSGTIGTNVTLTPLMTLTSGGNVGIGTTTPARGLSIFNNTIGLYSSATGQGGTDGYTMELSGTIAYLWNYENDSLIFGTNNTERMRITSDGYLRMASGTGGIQFNGDTAAANALDDYEEGTWTPVIGGTGGESGQSYGGQTGHYTKVGRLVTVTFRVLLSNKGTITGSAAIKGLPFTISATVSHGAGVTYFEGLATSWSSIFLMATGGETYATIDGVKSAATLTTRATTSDIGNSTQFNGSMTYFV